MVRTHARAARVYGGCVCTRRAWCPCLSISLVQVFVTTVLNRRGGGKTHLTCNVVRSAGGMTLPSYPQHSSVVWYGDVATHPHASRLSSTDRRHAGRAARTRTCYRTAHRLPLLCCAAYVYGCTLPTATRPSILFIIYLIIKLNNIGQARVTQVTELLAFMVARVHSVLSFSLNSANSARAPTPKPFCAHPRLPYYCLAAYRQHSRAACLTHFTTRSLAAPRHRPTTTPRCRGYHAFCHCGRPTTMPRRRLTTGM